MFFDPLFFRREARLGFLRTAWRFWVFYFCYLLRLCLDCICIGWGFLILF